MQYVIGDNDLHFMDYEKEVNACEELGRFHFETT